MPERKRFFPVDVFPYSFSQDCKEKANEIGNDDIPLTNRHFCWMAIKTKMMIDPAFLATNALIVMMMVMVTIAMVTAQRSKFVFPD